MIARSAHHAKDVSKLYKQLTETAKAKEKKGLSGEEFINALMGALS